jgi:glycosyltransferase involved in cell wall biosynthesis
MDSDLIVTVGIPVYNAGASIRYALDSVLSQTYTNLEILITVDGSADDSETIIRSYNDPRIRLIADDVNRGIPFRLNQQVRMAKGKFFARMDADDIMFPDRIEKQLGILLGNPDIDVIGGAMVAIDEDNRVLGLRENNTVFSPESTLKTILFNHPTVFGRIEWFRNNVYNEKFSGVEDFYLWNMTVRHSRFHVMNTPFMFYRDPPRTPARTYLTRQKQLRKAICSLKTDLPLSSSVFLKLYSASCFKSLVFWFMSKIRMSRIIIARRNTPIPAPEKKYYTEMLERITSPH